MNEQKRTMSERNRSSMHPGDPLTIVGVEQADNDIRSQTPALLHSDRHAAVVNVDKAYERRLALFQNGGHKLQPITIARATVMPTRNTTRPRAAEGDVAPAKDPRMILLCVGILALALGSVWAYRHFASRLTRRAA